jgi:hypothetical protein
VFAGSGEMEAFCELFFDNLATLLGVTSAAIGDIGYRLIAASWRPPPAAYNFMIAQEWEKIYYEVGGAQPRFSRVSARYTNHNAFPQNRPV